MINTLYNVPKYDIQTGEQLKDALLYYNVTPSQFARFMGVTQPAVQHWFKSNKVPPYITRLFHSISLFHPLYVHNRLTGKVDMLQNVRQAVDAHVTTNQTCPICSNKIKNK